MSIIPTLNLTSRSMIQSLWLIDINYRISNIFSKPIKYPSKLYNVFDRNRTKLAKFRDRELLRGRSESFRSVQNDSPIQVTNDPVKYDLVKQASRNYPAQKPFATFTKRMILVRAPVYAILHSDWSILIYITL